MTRALVVGGGIAGPVTAIALQKAGLQPVIYEAYERTAEGIGAFINIAPNGLDALACIGVDDLVRAHGFDTPAIAFYQHNGKPITGEVRMDRRNRNGDVIQTIQRSALYIALRDEAARRGIEIRYGHRLVGASNTATGVRAEFTGGRTAEGDLLVGADGLRSRVRRVIDPAAPAPRYLSVLNAFGRARGVSLPGDPGVIRMFFGRRGFFSVTKHPDGDLLWFANPPLAHDPGTRDLGYTQDSWRSYLLDLFGGDAMPAAKIVRASYQVSMPTPTYDLPRVPVWHRGAMVVIGDAAHAVSPTAGQGASMAMEDAVILARSLRGAPSLSAAFATYESIRRRRVEDIVAQGKYNNEGNLRRGPAGRLIRNWFLARAFRDSSGTGGPTWMSDHHIDWDVRTGETGASEATARRS